MYAEIAGPTLNDLKLKLDTGYEELAVALSARGAGTFPGCIVGGILIDKLSVYSHFILALTLDVAAVAVLFMPWVTKVIYLWLLCFISGFVQSIHNAAGTRIALDIWKDKSASPVILMHLGYGIGSFLAPLYADHFLADKVKNSTTINKTHVPDSVEGLSNVFNTTTEAFNSSEHLQELTYFTESNIEYAYAISGIATACISIPFFIFQIIENRFNKQLKENGVKFKNKSDKNVQTDKEEQLMNVDFQKDGKKETGGCKNLLKLINSASCAKGRFWYGFSILLLMFFHFGNAGGGQGLIATFIRSYSIDQLSCSKSDGSLINTSVWISFSLGRFIFFILARWISIKVLIIIETFGAMCFAILVNVFADDNSVALWILIQPIGFFWGPLWPTGVAWTDYHMELTGMGMASQMLGAATLHIVYMRMIGYFYDNTGPHTYLYHVTGSAIFGFILAVGLEIIGARHGNRFASNCDKTSQHLEVKEEKVHMKKKNLNDSQQGSNLIVI